MVSVWSSGDAAGDSILHAIRGVGGDPAAAAAVKISEPLETTVQPLLERGGTMASIADTNQSKRDRRE